MYSHEVFIHICLYYISHLAIDLICCKSAPKRSSGAKKVLEAERNSQVKADAIINY